MAVAAYSSVKRRSLQWSQECLHFNASQSPISLTLPTDPIICPSMTPRQAFYLAHVDSCLALAVMSVPATPAAMNALPSRPKHVLDQNEDEKQEPMSEDGLREEDAPLTWESLGLPSCVVRDTSGGTRDDTPTLTAEQAWQYCCARRSSFPAMFAVYRHFRDQGCVRIECIFIQSIIEGDVRPIDAMNATPTEDYPELCKGVLFITVRRLRYVPPLTSHSSALVHCCLQPVWAGVRCPADPDVL